jgi:glycosyltransferase involved in cell wall biosynthesis
VDARKPVIGDRLRVAIDARKWTGEESGVGNYTRNLVEGLRAEDPSLELVLLWNSRRSKPPIEGLCSEEIAVPFPHDSPLTPFALRHFLRGRSFDVFHSPYELAPRGLAQPLVVTVHDVNWVVNPAYNSNNAFMRRAGGFFYRNAVTRAIDDATRVIAISNATRNAILEFAPWHEPKIRVVYHGVDRRRVPPADEPSRTLAHLIDPATPFVLTVGQGSPYKNHFHAVRGFLRAFRDRPDYRLVLVRRPLAADRDLDRLLETPQATAQVIRLPYVTREVLNALYGRARILLHPSYYEGFGLPLVEAMASGLPIVTSIVSAMPEIAGPAAVLVSPADEEAIARALVRLDQDEILREKLIAAGRQRLAMFDWEATVKATLEVYREAAGKRVRTEAEAEAGNAAPPPLR